MTDRQKELDRMLVDLTRGRDPRSKTFLKKVWNYNNELACGSATTHQSEVQRGRLRVVKINGMITYRLFGMNPPVDPVTGAERPRVLSQIWTLQPEDAIQERLRHNADQSNQYRLDVIKNIFVFKI
jgi:hypothetical protein